MADSARYIPYQPPPQRPLTAGNLADYALCPQKYLLSFFVTPAQVEWILGGAAALRQAVRAALIECYRRGGPPSVSAEQLQALFAAYWDGSRCADSLEEERLSAQGHRMLAAYHQAHYEEPMRAVAHDLRMEQVIGGHRFVAVADRVDETDPGEVLLLRYRTTRRAPGPRKLGEELSSALLWLVGERHFDRPARVEVYALHPGKLIVAQLDASDRARWEERLTQQAEALRQARDYPPRVGRHCQACRSRRQCPAWHPAPDSTAQGAP